MCELDFYQWFFETKEFIFLKWLSLWLMFTLCSTRRWHCLESVCKSSLLFSLRTCSTSLLRHYKWIRLFVCAMRVWVGGVATSNVNLFTFTCNMLVSTESLRHCVKQMNNLLLMLPNIFHMIDDFYSDHYLIFLLLYLFYSI